MKPFILDPTDSNARADAVGAVITQVIKLDGKRVLNKGARLTDADLPVLAQLDAPVHAVRLDPDNRDELDYYLLPWLDLPRQEIRLCNRTSIAFEAFRFEDLGFFYGMAERVGIRRKWG